MAKLNKNRRLVIMLVALSAIVLTLGAQAFTKVTTEFNRAESQARQAKVRLEQTIALRQRVESQRAGSKALEDLVRTRGEGFDLYSFTNACVQEKNLQNKAKLSSKGPTFAGGEMQGVQLDLKDVTKKELIAILHRLYVEKRLVVLQRLHHLRPSRTGKGIDCQMTLIAPKS